MSFDGGEKAGRPLDLVQRYGIVPAEQLIRIVPRGIENIEIVEGFEPAWAGRETPCERGLPGLSSTGHDHDRHDTEMRTQPGL